jgi:hypothetical protein
MAGAETRREVSRVTVATVRTMADAQRLKALLNAEKLESFVVSERAVATSRSEKRYLAAINIQVSRPQALRAVAVLRAHSEKSRSKEFATKSAATGQMPAVNSQSTARTMVPMAAVLALALGVAWLLLS